MRLPIMKLLLACAAGCASPGPAWAQAYQLVGKAAGGDALYVAVLDNTGTVKTVRTRLLHGTPVSFNTLKNIVASVSVERVDCEKKLRTTERLEMYDSLAPDAVPVWTQDLVPGDRKPVAVDVAASTASTLMFRMVCLAAPSPDNPAAPTPWGQAAPAAPPAMQPSLPPSLPPALPPPTSPPPLPPPPALQPTPATPPAPDSRPPTLPAPVMPAPSPTLPAAGIAGLRPFEASRFTLGLMGRLAEYIYVDQPGLVFHEAAADKSERIRRSALQDGQAHPLLDEAARRWSRRATIYRERISSKDAFLQQQGLKAVRLPTVSPAPPKAFRAELYQHAASGDYILVFRGTQEGSDWLTNAWSGVDWQSVEAPHYRAAFDLVEALRKQHITPLVVGHSLGGGLAQYVGYKFGLKVVGFNSAPLPRRYFTGGAGASTQYIRLFSSIEFMPQSGAQPGAQPAEGHPDPVSISIPNVAAFVNRQFPDTEPVKAHELLVKPICVRSVPSPLYTANEQESYNAIINAVLTHGMVSAVAGGVGGKVTDVAVVKAIRSKIGSDMSGPQWHADRLPNVDNQAVVDAVKHEVTQVAVDAYETAGGLTSIAKSGYKFTMSNSVMGTMSGMGALGATLGKMMAAQFAVVHLLQPHSMERFNRGMIDVAGAQVFLADPVRAQCATQATLY